MRMRKHDAPVKTILAIILLIAFTGFGFRAFAAVSLAINYGKVANNLPAPAEVVSTKVDARQAPKQGGAEEDARQICRWQNVCRYGDGRKHTPFLAPQPTKGLWEMIHTMSPIHNTVLLAATATVLNNSIV